MSLAGGGEGPSGYLVPLIAIAPGDEAATGYVFKFDPDAGCGQQGRDHGRRRPRQHDRGIRGGGGRRHPGGSRGELLCATGRT